MFFFTWPMDKIVLTTGNGHREEGQEESGGAFYIPKLNRAN